MTYQELEKALSEWKDKVLKTKENTNGFIDMNSMIEDIMDILEKAFNDD